ncbi:RDD family protein [Planctomycetota bacterium]|nr:RDD family protein [Planctomycetota bacterium]
MKPNKAIMFSFVSLLIFTLSLALPSLSSAQNLSAVSDDQNIWYIYSYQQPLSPTTASATNNQSSSADSKPAQPQDQYALAIYHRNINQPAGDIALATIFNGQLATDGLASAPDRLWLAYKLPNNQGLAFQTLTPILPANQAFYSYEPSPQPPIFHSADLRSLAASRSRAFALLRFESYEQASEAERDLAPSNTQLEPLTSINPPLIEPSEAPDAEPSESNAVTDTTTPEKTEKPNETANKVSIDRLFILIAGRWQHLSLPSNYPHAKPAWLVVQNSDALYPTLITQPDTQQNTFRVDQYNPATESWETKTVNAPLPDNAKPASRPAFFAQDNQIILAQQLADKPDLVTHYTILRDSKAISVGMLDLAIPNTSQWAAIPYNNNLALLAARPEHKPTKPTTVTSMWGFTTPAPQEIALDLSQLTLQGQPLIIAKTETNIQTLTPTEPRYLEMVTQNIISIILIGLAILMIILLVVRDPRNNKLELPDNLTLCDFPRRMLAASIDFAIVFFPIMYIFDLSFSGLSETWPNNGNLTFTKMIPSITLIAVFLAHTTITEMITKGRTLGKIFTGIHVTTMDGKTPSSTQLFTRGISKIIELLIQIALLFPVFIHTRQRLGDILAKTVVVMPKEKDKAHHLKEDEHDPSKTPPHDDDDQPNDLTKH